MNERSVHSLVKEYLQQQEPGAIIFPNDLLSFGSPEAIHTALSRLTEEKAILRLGKGIYQVPKMDPIVGLVKPSLDAIAKAVAQKEHVTIRPTGLSALNKLGLSTQVPMKVVYLTDGNARSIKIGKGTITFKRATPKRLAVKDETLYLVIEAIKELGTDKLSPAIIKQLIAILKQQPLDKIKEYAKLAPQSVARTLYNLVDDLATYD